MDDLLSLHDGMEAEVTVDGQVASEIEVHNRLKQGCAKSSANCKLRDSSYEGLSHSLSHQLSTTLVQDIISTLHVFLSQLSNHQIEVKVEKCWSKHCS